MLVLHSRFLLLLCLLSYASSTETNSTADIKLALEKIQIVLEGVNNFSRALKDLEIVLVQLSNDLNDDLEQADVKETKHEENLDNRQDKKETKDKGINKADFEKLIEGSIALLDVGVELNMIDDVKTESYKKPELKNFKELKPKNYWYYHVKQLPIVPKKKSVYSKLTMNMI